ncbi:hypothetical protein BDV12DRAFT_197432 [Aspergillus spectabilis]
MEATTGEEGHRTSVPSKWANPSTNTQIRAFRNPGVLCYRNTAILMLLHTPLLANWIEEVHPKRHTCGTTDMNLLCAFHHLVGFYWFGDLEKDTHEICMDRIRKKLLATTWSNFNIDEPQEIRGFMEAVFGQLITEAKINAKRHSELQQYFRIGLRTRLVCRYCETESSVSVRKLFLNASFPESPSAAGITPSQSNGSAEPPSSTEHLDQLPEVLFVQVNHYGNQGQLTGKLDLKDTLTIPGSLHYPDSQEKQDVEYELYSVIFRGKDPLNNTLYFCAAKGPTGKWALVNNDFVVDELTLDKLLDMADDQQPAYILAYRRLP